MLTILYKILMTELDKLKSAKGLKLCHLNIRSILSKIDQFKLQFDTSVLDVISISETWLTENNCSSILSTNNYQMFRSDRAFINDQFGTTKKGGGLLMFIRKDLNFSVCHDISLNLSTPDVEVQLLQLKSSVQRDILIYNVYRPPNGSVTRCLDLLSGILENESNLSHKEILFMGDFNINYQSKSNPDTKKLIAWHHRLGLTQIIKSKTRYSKNSSSLIDLIFTNMDHIADSGTLNAHLSDHQPIYIIKKKLKDHRRKVSFSGRTYVGYNKELLSDCLTNSIKESFRKEADPNKCWELMEAFLIKFLDNNCPKKNFRTKEDTPTWVTHDLITLAKDRDSAWERAVHTNSEDDWILARQLRNWANNAVKSAKANFIKNELTNNATDPKKFWRNIKSVLPEKDSGSINIVNSHTSEILPKPMQAQVINDFFANIGSKLDAKFKKKAQMPKSAEVELDGFEIDHISPQDVVRLINSISMYKSSGIDDISSRVVKDFMYLALREMSCLYNLIIYTGIFPDKWKIASVTPIPQVANAANPTDLRPISLLPVPGKLLEKYISDKIYNFLEHKDFFSNAQFGFRKERSTTGAFTNFLDEIICI